MVEQKDEQAAPEQDHQVNFFRPASEHAKANMKLISSMVVIWAVAVFGFQFLLIAMQKPVAEENHGLFEQVWPAVSQGQGDAADRQSFGKVTLAVLGKNVAVSGEHKDVLKGSLTATVRGLMTPAQLSGFDAALADEDTAKASDLAAEALALGTTGFEQLMRELLPTSLVETQETALTETQKQALPGIMSLYLIHNRSALTDFRFLGFPFHYWYTAQFLLILFVVLCLVYAVLIDKIHKKHGFVEE